MNLTVEKFVVGFAVVLTLAVIAGAGYRMSIDRDCVQNAIHQNYPADAIKKICR